MPDTWKPIKDEPAEGTFLWLKREQRVTFGRREGKAWLSWDGGFTKKAPPTHFMIAPYQDWHMMRTHMARTGKPGP